MPNGEATDVAATSTTLAKSLRNQNDYLRRKNMQMRESYLDMKDKLDVANDQISDLQHTNSLSIRKADRLKAEAEKSSNLLATRTERFVEFHDDGCRCSHFVDEETGSILYCTSTIFISTPASQSVHETDHC